MGIYVVFLLFILLNYFCLFDIKLCFGIFYLFSMIFFFFGFFILNGYKGITILINELKIFVLNSCDGNNKILFLILIYFHDL